MPGPLLFCMKIEKSVYYSVPDNKNLLNEVDWVGIGSKKHGEKIPLIILQSLEVIMKNQNIFMWMQNQVETINGTYKKVSKLLKEELA